MIGFFHKQLKITVVIAALAISAGCASSGDPRDPIEGFNRGVYTFNENFDEYIFNPVARGYHTITPAPVDKSITNFFNNIDDVTVAINDLLQFEFMNAAQDVGRIALNSTIGILGLFDVASQMDLEKRNEDFGQTLAYWGVGSGPYLVLPILGPSNVRDTAGIVVDRNFDPISYIDHIPTRNTVIVLKAIDLRADLLAVDDLKETITQGVDPYDFFKDAYLQRREWLIYDGEPPEDDDAEYGDDDEAYYDFEEDMEESS
jgi:phospholipid-binding lipoprotein MlaA